MLGNGVEQGRLKRLHLQLGGLLLEEAFNTHDDIAFGTHVLSYLLVFLDVELTDQSFVDIEKFLTNLAFLQNQLTLCAFARYEYALQNIELLMSHGAVFARQLTGYISR